MSAAARLRTWWKALAHRASLEKEMEAELRFHIESYAADLVRNGVKPDDAIRRARLELGTIPSQQEDCRSSFGVRPWDDLLADLRYAFRQLRHTPAFTVTVLVVLALGIGANAAMFSIVDATLLRWLPYHRPGELVSINLVNDHGGASWGYYQDVIAWQGQSHTLQSMAYYNEIEGFLETKSGQEPVSAYTVSANLFSVLGVQPAQGRPFLADEQTPGKGRIVILSNAVWRNILQADPGVVGKQVTLNDQPYTVVGIMPPRFLFPADENKPQIWIPAEITPAHFKMDFAEPRYQVISRIHRGSSLASIGAELSGIESRQVTLYPTEMRQELPLTRVAATPYRETLVAQSRPALLALIAAVAIMWMIACANVANLMLARSMARQREIAVRGALGASRWRIVRQLFTESLVLSALGSAAGLGLAQLALWIFNKTLSLRLNLPGYLAPNPAVLIALLVLSVLSAVLFGLLPAWLASGTPLEHALRQTSVQAGGGRGRHRLQQAMVVAEIGLSLVLLIACGLLLRTVFALRQVPLGFRTDHVLMVQPNLPRYKYRGLDTNHSVYQPLLRRIQQIPGVRSASITTLVPLHKGFAAILSLFLEAGKESSGKGTHIDAQLKAAGPELQDVLGFRMARGRYFNQQDTPDSPPVAVVNKAFAQLYLPAGDVMEKFSIGSSDDRKAKIVGVIEDFHQTSIDHPSSPEIDFCATQLRPTDGFYQPTLLAHVEIAVRTQTAPEEFIPALRRAMLEVNPDLQTSSVQTMGEIVEESIGSQTFAAHMLEVFGGTALLVALAGLYGLLSYLVAQRNRELGVRIALGAQRRDIMGILLGQASRMLLAGAAIGIALAYFFGRLLAGFLFGVQPHDLVTMFAVTVLLLACGLAAAYLPARTASRVDPMQALRGE
jgi:putative ABC transport system permease protein